MQRKYTTAKSFFFRIFRLLSCFLLDIQSDIKSAVKFIHRSVFVCYAEKLRVFGIKSLKNEIYHFFKTNEEEVT